MVPPFPVVHLAHLFPHACLSPREVRENFRLERSANEWVLLHGTSAAAAEAISRSDFTMRLAGSATGTLYGRGVSRAASTRGRNIVSGFQGVVFLQRVLQLT